VPHLHSYHRTSRNIVFGFDAARLKCLDRRTPWERWRRVYAHSGHALINLTYSFWDRPPRKAKISLTQIEQKPCEDVAHIARCALCSRLSRNFLSSVFVSSQSLDIRAFGRRACASSAEPTPPYLKTDPKLHHMVYVRLDVRVRMEMLGRFLFFFLCRSSSCVTGFLLSASG